jgi:hypothetical protein
MSASLDQPSLGPDSTSGGRSDELRSAGLHSEGDDFAQYRSLSATAVVALLFGVLSIVAILPDYWTPKAVPAVGMALAVAAIFRIRSRSDELSGIRPAMIGLGLSAFFLVGGSAFTVYSQIAEVPEGCTRITYEQLKPSDDRPNAAPESARALNGQRVFIKGYMFPTDHDSGITRFVLCRDSGDCCFGGNPPLSDMIFVQLKEPLQARFNGRLRHLAGTFRVAGSHSTDVKKNVLYALEADYIK